MKSTQAAELKIRADKYAEQGKTELALKNYYEALGLKEDYFEVHANLGNILGSMGRTDDAIKHYRRAVELRPDVAELHTMLGNALRIDGHLNEALACHNKALDLNPALISAHTNKGYTLKDLGHEHEALKAFDYALKAKPSTPDVHYSFAVVLGIQGHAEAAIEHYREASRQSPDFTAAVMGEARMLAKQGKLDAARACFRPFADRRSSDPSVAIAYSYLVRNDDERRESIDMMQQMLKTKDIAMRQSLYFRLGDLYDDLEAYDMAFENYRHANQLVGKTYDRAVSVQFNRNVIEGFTARKYAAMPRSTNTSDMPVFVVGLPRAGKTLAEQMLASHSRVTGAGELEDFRKIAEAIAKETGAAFPLGIEKLTVKQLDDYANQYLEKLKSGVHQGTTRVVNTMPDNYMYLGLIKLLFPQAHLIHLQRNPLDQCLECYFKKFHQAEKYAYTSKLDDLAFVYAHYIQLMNHWTDVLGLSVLDVRYETLVLEPEASCRALLEYVGLEWDPRCLNFHHTGTSRLLQDQLFREPLDTRFIDRWKHYDKYIGPLEEALAQYL